MKNVLVRLQEYSAQATTTEKEVIAFLLKEPEQAAGCSIHELAERTFSSTSTVIRLCQKTGFRGYKEFQQSLLYELAIRKDSVEKQMEEIRREDSLEEIVNKVTYKNIVSLENTRKLIDIPVLEKCVELLVQCRAVYLFGLGSSLLVARDAYLKFLRVNKECFLCDDWHAQYLQAMNIREGSIAIIISYSGMTKEEIDKRVTELLALVDLTDKRDTYPSQLSGGQKQRVAIARALANNPQILLSDEATSALDPDATEAILALLKQLNEKLGLTIVLITHSRELAAECPRIITLRDGCIVADQRKEARHVPV